VKQNDQTDEPTLVIVGPIRPTRGGIAKHTEHFVTALSKRARCQVLADSRLYPRFAYPGKTEHGSDQTILDKEAIELIRLPFSRLWIRLVAKTRKSVLGTVLIWWTPALAPKFLATVLVAKLKRLPTVVFCHNVASHETSALDRILTRLCLRRASSFVVQTDSEAILLRTLVGANAEIAVIPHPIYSEEKKIDKTVGRAGPVRFLFFGLVRRYKGVSTLLDASRLNSGQEFQIRIVGESWDKNLTGQILDAQAEVPTRVSSRLEYIDEDSLVKEIDEADYVVLPYLSATGSGVLSLAKARGKPVILSRIIEFVHEITPGVDGFFFEPGDARGLAEVLSLAADRSALAKLHPWKGRNSDSNWEELADVTLGLMSDTDL
jgi:glycosyltransferase involved in cell wall biosynthesis